MIIFFYSGLVIIFNTPGPLNFLWLSPPLSCKSSLIDLKISYPEFLPLFRKAVWTENWICIQWDAGVWNGVVSLLPPLSHFLAGAYNKTELVWIVEIWALIPGNNLHLLTQLRSFHVITTTIKSSTYQTSPTHAISPLHKKYLERLWEVN